MRTTFTAKCCGLACTALLAGSSLNPAPLPAQKDDAGVVVAWFENRTGDAGLDAVGAAAADWLAAALGNARIGRVVGAAEVRRIMNGAGGPMAGDALARRTGSGLLVRGHFSRRGTDLEFTAELVNVARGAVLATSGPWRGPPETVAAFDALFQDLATVLDMRRVWGEAGLFWPRPNDFLAWRLLQQTQQNYFARGDYTGALPGLHLALERDSTWLTAKYMLWVTNGNLGRTQLRDSIGASLQAAMTAASGPLHDVYDWLASSHRGDHEAMYQAGRTMAQRDPVGVAYEAALPAVRTGRYTEVVRLYGIRDTTDAWVMEWRAWDNIAISAMHLLGRHEEELRAARDNVVRRGLDWNTGNQVVTALAALGRMEDLEAALQEMTRLAPAGGNTFGGSLAAAGWELLAHGNPRAGRQMFQRRLDHYRAMPAPQQAQYAPAIANSLLLLGNYREAMARYDSLSRAAPADLVHLGHLGIAAVLAGNRAEIAEVEARLVADGRPATRYWRSFMAAQQGDCAAAAQLLREGLARGLVKNDYGFHRWNTIGRARSCAELPALTGPITP